MVPLPKRKLSTRRQGKRRALARLKSVSLSQCPNCGQPYLPHRVCGNCGYYRGKQVKTIKTKKSKS